jgi:hypothetical protein
MALRTINPRLFVVAFSSLIVAAFLFPGTALAEPWSGVAHGPAFSGVAVPGLDLGDLERRLRRTDALGIFAKLALKERLDSLIQDFALFHEGRRDTNRQDLKARFDGLLTDTAAMLRKGDPALSATIEAAHRGLWTVVSDPGKFFLMGDGGTAWRQDSDAFMPGARS